MRPHPQQALAALQRKLALLNDSPVVLHVKDYLVVDESQGREALMISVAGQDLDVSLHLAPALLEGLTPEAPALGSPAFDRHCAVVEGLSHLAYVAFRHGAGQDFSALELEVQAEVDKYALVVSAEVALEGRGVGLMRTRARSRSVRAQLFDDVTFAHPASSELGQRYRRANTIAAQQSERLEEVLLREGPAGLVREARRFYRRGLIGKSRRLG